MQRVSIWVLGAVLTLLAGCGSSPSSSCTPCTQDFDCLGSETCRRFVCVSPGGDSAQCPNAGVPPTSGGSGSSGSSTSASSGSSGGSTASSTGGSTGGSTGSIGPVSIVGLADDPDWHQSKTFALQCTPGNCTWRYRIDQSPSGGFTTESYAAMSQIVVNADPSNPDTPTGSYYLHVQARDTDSESAVVTVSFKIDVTPPTVPGSVTSSLPSTLPASDPSGITASWTASTDAESGLAGYQVALVRLADNFPVTGWLSLQSGATLPNIYGLLEGDYAVQVRAVDNVGNVSAPGQGGTGNLTYSGADNYSDDPNLPIRNGKPTFGQGLFAVPTFHSVGLYWAVSGGSSSVVASVQFRPAGSTSWRDGLPLWFDSRNSEYRGSLVLLQPGTKYEVQVALASGATASTTVSTWSETFPIARTVTLPAGTSSSTITINDNGTPNGYVLYVADPSGTTVDQGFPVGSTPKNCVDVTGSYLIVRGLTLKNCKANGIEVHAGSHDVVIEQNDISGFGYGAGGEIQGPTDAIVPGTYEQGGVFCKNVGKSPKAFRIIVQRNKIHDPRYGSIHWGYAHPNSANAIFFGHCGPNNVFRYNEVYSSIGHYYGDGIGGSDNFTFEGFPNADSDIYGNKVSETYDDAIEADGANRNVRIWGNYMHHTFNGISQAANSVGPCYTFRNIVNETAGMTNPVADTPDQEDRAELLKTGDQSDSSLGNGRMYVFNNTTLQPSVPGMSLPGGVGQGINHAGGTSYDVVSRNNILWVWKSWWDSILVDSSAGPVDLDYDLYNGNVSSTEDHGINGTPTFNADLDPGLQSTKLASTGSQYSSGTVYLPTKDPSTAGDFTLAPSSPGYHAGISIPNFTDRYASPDVGAHQSGTSPMEFGVNAYLDGFPPDY